MMTSCLPVCKSGGSSTVSLRLSLLLMLGLGAKCSATFKTPGVTPTTCESTTVVRGEHAAITCSFGRDVSLSRHDIEVQFYPLSGYEPVSLLKCNWLVRKPDTPTCTVHSGCTFTSVNDTLTINISNATKEFEGTYRCQLVPSDGIPAHSCSLTVTDGDSSQENQGIRRNGTVTFNNNSTLPEATPPNVPAIVLGISVIILVVVNITFLFLWRRERKKQESHSRSSRNRKFSLSKFTPMLGVGTTLTKEETLQNRCPNSTPASQEHKKSLATKNHESAQHLM